MLVLKNAGWNICVLILTLHLPPWANSYIFWSPIFTSKNVEWEIGPCHRFIVINKWIINIRRQECPAHYKSSVTIKYDNKLISDLYLQNLSLIQFMKYYLSFKNYFLFAFKICWTIIMHLGDRLSHETIPYLFSSPRFQELKFEFRREVNIPNCKCHLYSLILS